ncbi:hypothetical protein CKM354_000867600 [Cercospora kikuchii]|uniref:DUF1996 domain-containing protein n=1 Tax=Cercospora kikuchii TaxID=84275 RepID=A0A9P3FFH4_9PEZI|nr:uncharacterized protein CKM354_000867600 [Cercospora kikuchii]GIZ45513.1 hypothetical protein CKM354_000867600 [Cercospora kikuchii]
MKGSLYAAAAALATTAHAAQFVMYSPGSDIDLVERADAIVTPGKISAHVHQIFGASNAASDMTYESLQKSKCTTVGNAAGAGNAADKSVYWVPSLFGQAKDGSGYVRIPSGGHKLYYRDVGNANDKKAEPFEFPKGFFMVAGDQTRRAANNDSRVLTTEWICHCKSGQNNGVDQKTGFPADVSNCDSYPGFAGSLHFPHCWNGKMPKVNDNSHMAYPEGDVQSGPCPSSHPTRLPHIFLENFYDLAKVADKIKPNSFSLSQGDPTGYGLHADFFNGWDEGAIPKLFDDCPQPYYGNSDVGTCPSFQGFDTKNTDCKLTPEFKENVDSPGKYLPGCNPITTDNPAQKMKPAPLGVCSNECTPASGASEDSPASYEAPPSYGSSKSQKTQSTTLATKQAASTPAGYSKPEAPKADEKDDDNVVYVTAMVTVTAPGEAAATPAGYAQHKRHEHIHRHKRHH